MLQLMERDSTALVRRLRGSSRRLVRALGVLQARLDGGCTPVQAHALIEVDAHGPLTVGGLAELLEVDKSTASRTVKPLIAEGLLERVDDPADQRTKPLVLGAAGRERVAAIHADADRQVTAALDLLTPEERDCVLRGVDVYERALHRARALGDALIRPIEARDDREVAQLIREVMTEFAATGEGTSIHDGELAAMHSAYSAPGHAYFVVERRGEIVASGGIAPLAGGDDDTCELRKMFARPSVRGLGLGRRLLERCLAAAREAGYSTCYLETLQHMHAARALYEKLGFERLDERRGDTGHHACHDWYARAL